MLSSAAIAFMSDVHGNALALEAVLSDIRRHAPDAVVNLGDQVWGQVDPLGAYELQASIDAVEVRGNNDEKPLLGPRLPAFEQPFAAWLSERVPQVALERLAALPLSATLLDGRVLATHGTPSSPWANLLWRLEGGGLVPRASADVRMDLTGVADDVEVVVVGHTHMERVLELDGRLLVNVGPVCWQKDGDPRARWTLLTRHGQRWTVDQRRVEYDWHAAARAVLANTPVFDLEVAALLEARDQRKALKSEMDGASATR